MGPRDEDKKEIKILNRVIRYTENALEYEAVPRHHEIIIDELHLRGAKGVTSPGIKELPEEEGDNQPLRQQQTTKYRAIVARCNFLALDRGDIMFAAKECSRTMSAPCQKDWRRLKRIGRYLIHKPRVVVRYCWQENWNSITGSAKSTELDATGVRARGFSDSDWAGCPMTEIQTINFRRYNYVRESLD